MQTENRFFPKKNAVPLSRPKAKARRIAAPPFSSFSGKHA
jgi:hypothetical protein